MAYACYIGRWQTWHPGHEWLINQQLSKGKDVLIMIRDMKIDENNPKDAVTIFEELVEVYEKEIAKGRVKLMIIPDIESFNYGRKVGYDIIEHQPPEDIEKISGTKIRSEKCIQKATQSGLWGSPAPEKQP